MRNDVKLGLAVGGILLAVLIVYVLVVPSSDKQGAELVIEDVDTQPIDQGADAVALADETPAEDEPRQPAKRDDSVATNDETSTEVSVGEAAQPERDPFENAQANAEGEWDWNKLLNPADTPELMLPTNVSTKLTPDQPPVPSAVETTAPPVIDSQPTSEAPAEVRNPIADPPMSTPVDAVSTKHTVAAGETFSSIAEATYGQSRFYPHIMRANPSIDPARLKPGTIINLPSVSDVKVTTEGRAESNTSASTGGASVNSTTDYRVVAGDSLERISIKLYGNRGKVVDLFELNKEGMGNDPARLKVGQVIKLPSPPTVTVAAN